MRLRRVFTGEHTPWSSGGGGGGGECQVDCRAYYNIGASWASLSCQTPQSHA